MVDGKSRTRAAERQAAYYKARPGYTSWFSMVSRCRNPRNNRWAAYGGRGVTVVDAWVGPGGYERFIAHIGPRPSPGHSIDRIDVNGHYEPGNVRWATRAEQSHNTRNNVWVVFRGERLLVTDLAARTGIQYRTLRWRLRAGHTPESAVAVMKYTRAREVRNATDDTK